MLMVMRVVLMVMLVVMLMLMLMRGDASPERWLHYAAAHFTAVLRDPYRKT